MSNGQYCFQQNWVPMIHGHGNVEPIPGSFCARYYQIVGPGQMHYLYDTPKQILTYPIPNTEIHLMSVLQTRDWIWNLGSCLGWASRDCWANAISFFEKEIDGSQLVDMQADDLRNRNIVKKLGHTLAIVRAVKVLKHSANIMQQLKYAGLSNGSQRVSVPFKNENLNTESDSYNLVKYHGRQSKSNPRAYKAYCRLSVPKSKSLRLDIATTIGKGSMVTGNMRKNQRARLLELKANGGSGEIGSISTHYDTSQQELAPCDDIHTLEK